MSAVIWFSSLNGCRPNIELSSQFQTSRITNLDTHTTYIPPHPQKGTKYHRYVLLLLPQESPTDVISIPTIPDEARLGFDVRAFIDRHGLDGSRGGGAHMWREVWDEEVSKIYETVLSMILMQMFCGERFTFAAEQDEPKYGVIPKPDPCRDAKQRQRYI